MTTDQGYEALAAAQDDEDRDHAEAMRQPARRKESDYNTTIKTEADKWR